MCGDTPAMTGPRNGKPTLKVAPTEASEAAFMAGDAFIVARCPPSSVTTSTCTVKYSASLPELGREPQALRDTEAPEDDEEDDG
jgi:hypothetical protein